MSAVDEQELPAYGSLSSHQQRGVHCVHCEAPLKTGALRDLGPRPITVLGCVVQWFPRSCRTCPRGES